MRWPLIVLTASLPLLVSQAAHTQQPSCEVACRVNPFTAPASCNCGAAGGEVQTPTPAPERTGVPDCEVACRTNPYTAPPTCDCTRIGRGGGGGGAGGGTGPGPSSSGIVDDGVLGVGELLDYMEALYRQRIAGVRQYYFVERSIVGQNTQAARSTGRHGIVLASTTRTMSARHDSQAGLGGALPGMPVLLMYRKVQKDGRPAMEPLTQREKRERTVKDPEIMAGATADERAAFEAIAKDPSILFGALGQVTDLFGADAVRVEMEKIAGSIDRDERDVDTFRDDVLLELVKLKRALQAESGSGGRLYPGSYDPDTRTFRRGPQCGSNQGCTAQEIVRFFGAAYTNAVDARDDAELAGQPYYPIRLVPCVFWRPSSDAVVTVGAAQGAGTADVVAAEFWLAIPSWVTKELFSRSPDAAPNWVDWQLELDELDRPLRMTIIVDGPDGLRRFDRIYEHFTLVQTGAGPALNEPRKIREEMGPCAPVGTQSDGSPLDCQGAATMVVDRLRSKFTVNQEFPSMVEEAQMIDEILGCIGTPSSDPDSPCYVP